MKPSGSTAKRALLGTGGILGGLWEKVRERPDEFLDRRMIEAEGSGVIVALHAAATGSLSRSADLRSGKLPEGGAEFRITW